MTEPASPSTDLWKVARVDVLDLPDDKRAEALAWVGQFADVDTVRPRLAVTQDAADKSYWLHLTRFIYRDGNKVLDLAAAAPQTEPLVIPITEWPAWLAAESRRQGAR